MILNLILKFCLGFCLSTIVMFFWIRKKVFSERIRKELLHLSFKEGTPSAAGLGFSLVSIFVFFITNKCFSMEVIILLCVVLLSLTFGFIDDLYKKTTGEGLQERTMITIQFLIGLIPTIFNYYHKQTFLKIPLFSFLKINLGFFYIPLISFFVFAGTLNGTGLTDGINGGLAVPTIIGFLSILIHFLLSIYYLPNFLISIDLFPIMNFLIIFIGSLFGFLIFNLRGKVFMGNTGSMTIGSIFATICILTKCEIPLIFLGLLYVIETLSVILQIFWIKKFKKKLILFSPIHHHFELLKYSWFSILSMMTLTSIVGSILYLITTYFVIL
jgi:phospho-N-acetylmuramoyl-pentapeptide-transferase